MKTAWVTAQGEVSYTSRQALKQRAPQLRDIESSPDVKPEELTGNSFEWDKFSLNVPQQLYADRRIASMVLSKKAVNGERVTKKDVLEIYPKALDWEVERIIQEARSTANVLRSKTISITNELIATTNREVRAAEYVRDRVLNARDLGEEYGRERQIAVDALREKRLQEKRAEVKRLQGLDDSRLDSLYESTFKNVMLKREQAKPKAEVEASADVELTPAEKAQGKFDLAVERSATPQFTTDIEGALARLDREIADALINNPNTSFTDRKSFDGLKKTAEFREMKKKSLVGLLNKMFDRMPSYADRKALQGMRFAKRRGM